MGIPKIRVIITRKSIYLLIKPYFTIRLVSKKFIKN
jgi:hypothetical protein